MHALFTCALTCSSRVWKRVKDDPMRKSISCLASTALASFSLGSLKLFMAKCRSLATRAENLARLMTKDGFTRLHTSTTWKQVFLICRQGLPIDLMTAPFLLQSNYGSSDCQTEVLCPPQMRCSLPLCHNQAKGPATGIAELAAPGFATALSYPAQGLAQIVAVLKLRL